MRHVNFDALNVIFRLPTILQWIPHILKPPYTNFYKINIKTTCPVSFSKYFLVYLEAVISGDYTLKISPSSLEMITEIIHCHLRPMRIVGPLV